MARAAMTRMAFGSQGAVPPFDTARYGLPPLPTALLLRELPAADDPIDETGGPGWYQSSRELRHGLEVRDAPFDEWLLASLFSVIAPLQAAA